MKYKGFVLFFRGAFLTRMGERLNGIQEVSGSIPLISTKTERACGYTVSSFQTFSISHMEFYSSEKPQFIEGNVFKLNLSLTVRTSNQAIDQATDQSK